MRISDDRYSRDRLRLDLALRFIHHEARTHTIRAWTGLTDDRIRKLYRTYLCEAGGAAVARHRGKSPRQAAFFTRSLRMRREAAVFASVSSLFGLITPQSIGVRSQHAQPAPTVARGALLCEAFEAYRALVGEPQISFEHAVFLLGALDVRRRVARRPLPRLRRRPGHRPARAARRRSATNAPAAQAAADLAPQTGERD